MNIHKLSRRELLHRFFAASALMAFGNIPSLAQNKQPPELSTRLTKIIPSTQEALPVIGMGTWITFNVGQDQALRNQRTRVLREFFRFGGGMIDCSPMYGSSADVLGYALSQLNYPASLFSASKVWTAWDSKGSEQIETQGQRWGLATFDLMQVHNLVNWEAHLETLKSLKAEGRIHYIGMTTSHGRRHKELENIMQAHKLDFVQLTYNIRDREVEDRLLPVARERGIAVIANRPFDGGALFHSRQGQSLPGWAKEEADANNWAEFFLKFIVSHPAITCAIPATSKTEHMQENMGSAYGILPDARTRIKMANYFQNL